MGMEIALIPAAMFIMGIGMMIYMKKKRGTAWRRDTHSRK